MSQRTAVSTGRVRKLGMAGGNVLPYDAMEKDVWPLARQAPTPPAHIAVAGVVAAYRGGFAEASAGAVEERLALVNAQLRVVLHQQLIPKTSAGGGDGNAGWDVGLVVVDVERDRDAELAQVIDAGDAPGFFPGLGKCWQEHGSENSDDGDDDEKFDKREAFFGVTVHDVLLSFEQRRKRSWNLNDNALIVSLAVSTVGFSKSRGGRFLAAWESDGWRRRVRVVQGG